MTSRNKPIRIVIVDDSLAMLWGLGKLIQGEAPRMMLMGTARTDCEALICAWLRPDVIVLDLDLGGYSSIEIIPALRRRSGGGVLIHTGLGDRRLHEDAMLFGAAAVVGKDAPAALLLDAIERVREGRGCGARAPQDVAMARTEGIGPLSPAERRLLDDLADAWHAPADVPRAPPILTQVVALYDKLGVRNRLELARFAGSLAANGSLLP